LVGDIIGRLVVVKHRVFDVKKVDTIEEEYFEDEMKVAIPSTKYNSIPSTYIIWFKHMYQQDPDDILNRYFDQDLQNDVMKFRKSDDYEDAKNKNAVEANYVWRIIPTDIRLRIQ